MSEKFQITPRLHSWLVNSPARSTSQLAPLIPPGIEPDVNEPDPNADPGQGDA